mmetsp:Transcript_117145/g.378067  ORF Transcript_117145/g.378067 Transcript_117145/m.378067 type:complete len:241 (-) Transcript_117145:95-817(-)
MQGGGRASQFHLALEEAKITSAASPSLPAPRAGWPRLDRAGAQLADAGEGCRALDEERRRLLEQRRDHARPRRRGGRNARCLALELDVHNVLPAMAAVEARAPIAEVYGGGTRGIRVQPRLQRLLHGDPIRVDNVEDDLREHAMHVTRWREDGLPRPGGRVRQVVYHLLAISLRILLLHRVEVVAREEMAEDIHGDAKDIVLGVGQEIGRSNKWQPVSRFQALPTFLSGVGICAVFAHDP